MTNEAIGFVERELIIAIDLLKDCEKNITLNNINLKDRNYSSDYYKGYKEAVFHRIKILKEIQSKCYNPKRGKK